MKQTTASVHGRGGGQAEGMRGGASGVSHWTIWPILRHKQETTTTNKWRVATRTERLLIVMAEEISSRKLDQSLSKSVADLEHKKEAPGKQRSKTGAQYKSNVVITGLHIKPQTCTEVNRERNLNEKKLVLEWNRWLNLGNNNVLKSERFKFKNKNWVNSYYDQILMIIMQMA